MSVVTTYSLRVDTNETLSTGVAAATDPVVTHTGFSTNGTLTASSTPPASLVAYETVALSGGSVTIDLSALTGTNGIAVNGNGLKVQVFKIKNTGTNAMTFTEGAANGYALLGSAWSLILLAGQEMLVQLNDLAPDIVTDTDDEIDVTGTGVETFELSIVMG